MMGGFATIFKTLLGGNPLDGVKGLIDEFHLSPEAKLAAQQAVAELAAKQEDIEAARDEALAEIQSKNITAETTSEDSFVRRARPALIWGIGGVVILNTGVIPLLQQVGFFISALAGHTALASAMSQVHVIDIPSPILELFGAIVLGYTGARTWEKVGGSGTTKAVGG